MKIALVHDDLIQHGGAERLFLAMIEAFPGADVFTSMISDHWKSEIRNPKSETNPNFQNSKLQTSFVQRLLFKEKLYRHYFPLYPLAFESFNLSEYDLVISSSTRFAHGVITRPETLHICYMNSPGRMFWEPHNYFTSSSHHLFISPFLSYLRLWDYAAAQRVDRFIANSKTPQARIKKYYGRDAKVIYPFVDLERFNIGTRHWALGNNVAAPLLPKANARSEATPFYGASNEAAQSAAATKEFYFLIVSRLASWKKIDIAISACNELQLPLKIIGEGPDFQRLKKLGGSTVELLGRLTDEEVVSYYRNCRAFLFPQKEDFGITPLEAMAAGKPVIAYKAGGALETIVEHQTGEFFYPQTTEALVGVLKSFEPSKYRGENCRAQAEKFSKKRFQMELKDFVESRHVL